MAVFRVDEVFNEARVPTLTYVPPAEAKQIRASLRTQGKHVTLVGASGSGKSTVAEKIIEDVFPKSGDVHSLSGRAYANERSIMNILGQEFSEEPSPSAVEPWLQCHSLIVIDDVHHLTFDARQELARMLKLWHEKEIKFLLIGIAKSSDQILGSDPELAIRNDVHTLATQSTEFLRAVLKKGEEALNIEFDDDFEAAAVSAAKGTPRNISGYVQNCLCRVRRRGNAADKKAN